MARGSVTEQVAFYDAEESPFYGICAEYLVLRRLSGDNGAIIRELGVGTGETMIEALRRSGFAGVMRGFEINRAAFEVAKQRIEASGMACRYVINNQDFFGEPLLQGETCAISNPPYLPAEDPDIRMPELWGGADGSLVARRLLTVGFERVMLMLSSYSNPMATIEHAHAAGYVLADWLLRPLSLGQYSREPRVLDRILALARDGVAFITRDQYLLCGTLWVKDQVNGDGRRSDALRSVLVRFGGQATS